MPTSSDPDIGTIRTELRMAIFWTCFNVLADEDDSNKHLGRQKAIGFCEFGVRSKLFSPVEGNDWLDGIWERTAIADVLTKYEPPEPEGKTDGGEADQVRSSKPHDHGQVQEANPTD